MLWRSPPGPWGLTSESRAGDCDEVTVSDHAPVFTALEIEVRSRPASPPRARGGLAAPPTTASGPRSVAAAASTSAARKPRWSSPLQVPVLPPQPTLHHCTLYISKLALYRARPPPRGGSGRGSGEEHHSANSNLTARSACGKGAPAGFEGRPAEAAEAWRGPRQASAREDDEVSATLDHATRRAAG